MADRISKARRSWNMSRIKGRDTKPELKLRSSLHRAGFRFRIHVTDLPGKPDIVLPRYRTAVFVHGCYWHRHPGCKEATTPKTNVTFWQGKFNDTVARDSRNRAALHTLGWKVLVAWECEIQRDTSGVVQDIRQALGRISDGA